MFQAPPLSAIDTADGREQLISRQSDANHGDISPTFDRRDESPSGSFNALDTDRGKSTSLKAKSLDSGETKEPLAPRKVQYVY